MLKKLIDVGFYEDKLNDISSNISLEIINREYAK